MMVQYSLTGKSKVAKRLVEDYEDKRRPQKERVH